MGRRTRSVLNVRKAALDVEPLPWVREKIEQAIKVVQSR